MQLTLSNESFECEDCYRYLPRSGCLCGQISYLLNWIYATIFSSICQLDSMSQVKPNKIANILRTSFQRIVITKTNVVPSQLFLYLISKSILQYIIEWELEKFQQYRNRNIPDCNPDHLQWKNRICMENKKMKNLKTSGNLYLNCPLNEVHENAKNIGFVSYSVFSAQR